MARTSLYGRLSHLPVVIEGISLRGCASETASGWVRRTTVVALRGAGHSGLGEDVTYEDEEQQFFQDAGEGLAVRGSFTVETFSRHIAAFDLFFGRPVEHRARDLRLWAFESAAVDLALRQAGLSLSGVLDRPLSPLRFVASLGLGAPPSVVPLERLRQRSPGLGFKVDFDVSWTEGTLAALSAVGGVATVDLKGQYRGTFQGPPADARLYGLVAERLPSAWIEDPEWNDETAAALAPHRERVTWDAPIHSLDDLLSRPNPVRATSIKPSRFGTWERLLAVYEHCEANGVAMYSGGQFELDVGRDQIQYLSAMFHPAAPNDCAPRAFNAAELPARLPESPLDVAPAPTGFALTAM